MSKNTVRNVMVRIPESDASFLEEEAKSKGTTMAAYCRELLIKHTESASLEDLVKRIVDERLKERFS